MKKPILVILLLGIAFAGYFYWQNLRGALPLPDEPQKPLSPALKPQKEPIEIIAENLQIPWELAFLPSGEILVTERPGRLLKIGQDRTIIEIQGVKHIGEGGLLGMALHPNFEQNKWIYLYLTTRSGAGLINRVERYRLEENKLLERKIIIDNIPGASFHDGGRMAFGKEFGPDWYLFVTTGDAGKPDLAQDVNSLAGKILRVWDDGRVPNDNPFGNAVFSYGHRNPQGITWDDQGRLWATEHGKSRLDELNLIEMGKNYGWPVIQGDERKPGMQNPIIHSGPNLTWAPAAAVFKDGSIFFTGLRGESVYQAKITEGGSLESLTTHFKGEFGRLRALKIGRDGNFYITTSNRDGRGNIKAGDDKIIRLDIRGR